MIGYLAKRFAPKLGDVDWEQRFAAMPDNAPPKWMFRNISEIHDNTERILELLEDRGEGGQRAARDGRRERDVKVLTVYAHQNPRSFCHGVLERFTAGLADAGHENEVVDLYAIKFDPVFRDRDVASYTSGTIPTDILDLMDLEQQVLQSCRGPLQRFLASRAMRGKSPAEIAAMIRRRMPKDVLAQQKKVAAADALAFIAPIHFCSFPSILKGWIDRVFTLDFAFGLTSEGWRGDINGRIPLLHHQRALIMSSTIFNEHAYDDGIRDAITRVIDDWGFRYPGIEDVEHVYFYAATAASPETIQRYLDQAYELGKTFDTTAAVTSTTSS